MNKPKPRRLDACEWQHNETYREFMQRKMEPSVSRGAALALLIGFLCILGALSKAFG